MTEAQRITQALGGTWFQSYGLACCPAHGDRNPSLSLSDGAGGRLLAHCKAGCSFNEVAGALRRLDILNAQGRAPQIDAAARARHLAEQRQEAARKSRQAQNIWDEALPAVGTLAETYLRSRRITCPIPETLRFHPACWHGATAKRLPAMVARIDGVEGFAVHRTYLRADGSGKSQDVPVKAMLGAVAGGAVRLVAGQGALAVAEGIETALSLSCGLLCGAVTVWAGLSASGISSLRLPSRAGKLIVAPDGDATGQAAAYHLAERASALGWHVSLFSAPAGQDWNDVLQSTKGASE